MPEHLSDAILHDTVLIQLPSIAPATFGWVGRGVGLADIAHERAISVRVWKRGCEWENICFENMDVEIEVF